MNAFPDNGDVKQLVVDWLHAQFEDASNKGYQSALVFSRALVYVKQFVDPIKDPKTLKSIQNVGDKTVANFSKHLVSYCKTNGYKVPESFDPEFNHFKRKETGESVEKPKKKRKLAQYVPRKRSGGYAILLALYFKDKTRSGLKKHEIIDVAAKYCDSSFNSNPSNNDFYSAWNSIKVLEKHELVSFTGRRTLWHITDEGIEVAKRLKVVEGLHSSPINEKVHVMSFDNGLHVSSDHSLSNSTGIELVSNPKDLLAPDWINSSKDMLPPDLLNSSPIKALPSPPKPTPPQPRHDSKKRLLNDIKYSIWYHDEYEVILIVDNREVRSRNDREYFENRFTTMGVKCEVRPLVVGDIAWIARHKKSGEEAILNTICERKRLDDLASSIKDGRFIEQKVRLTRSMMKRFYYLVEEGMSEISRLQNFTRNLQTAQSMTMIFSNFQLKKFKTLDETTAFLASLTDVIKEVNTEKKQKLIVMKPRVIKSQKQYGDIMEMFRHQFEERKYGSVYECCHLYSNFKESLAKSQMFTVKEMFLSMLLAIRGVSLERAQSIQQKFPTPKSLLDFFTANPNDATILSKAFTHEFGNKKIGKALSQKVYDIWGKR
ncbi:Crossover junction endonuclease mus81 [Yamadazyma tenuis]|uniref:Crossover junction endonuclease MUS81 n=1 Tax=Candida tenuis (strain ATCC 10573 / BCRC 21748 / CBS 615 / JCM 9827 / NBRC 10315 / NRRL Y-1498 / VKM Y-70) TaxID=590646 RepID=G3B6S1_CANTC|nr:crossover junction endonuclease MUS81 [Yamadazyma tenuis ATCC 10573]EGV63003.1 crossover junction endonuclease MUS81 [Yamadazyma tenuis ATCC 10573]WEJ97178.1 Crossover junction endonuclease mus81 [Yamadazyma tenuis]